MALSDTQRTIFDVIIKLGAVLGFGVAVIYLILENHSDMFGTVMVVFVLSFIAPIVWYMNARLGRQQNVTKYDYAVIILMFIVVMVAMTFSFMYYFFGIKPTA